MARLVIAIVACCGLAACESPPPAGGPNVLWIVWDTVRADRMSLYGYERETTPFLEQWSAGARVFEDCVSTAGSTVPSHASMFTGRLPSEHGAFHTRRELHDDYDTVAELLSDAGYRTFLFAANAHIQEKLNFTQGFDLHQHPWSPRWKQAALQIMREKVSSADRSSTLPGKVRSGDTNEWDLHAAGDVARQALVEWLDDSDDGRPWFAFLNYMEAHSPYVPEKELRARFLTPEQVAHSYEIDNRSATRWAYTFGQHEYPDGDLETLGGVYDATLLELDRLFEKLLGELEARGELDDTVVILVADHGEHLCEHHMLDHQYALYQPLLHVPLVVHYPEKFAPGRDRSPVMNFDLFPTVLELVGLPLPETGSQAVSLLTPRAERSRMAEYPAVFEVGIRQVKAVLPEWDPTPWRRRMRALFRDGNKLVCSTDGQHELFDLEADVGELDDRYGDRPELGRSLMGELLELSGELATPADVEEPDLGDADLEMLEALGYVGDDDAAELEAAVEAALCGYADIDP